MMSLCCLPGDTKKHVITCVDLVHKVSSIYGLCRFEQTAQGSCSGCLSHESLRPILGLFIHLIYRHNFNVLKFQTIETNQTELPVLEGLESVFLLLRMTYVSIRKWINASSMLDVFGLGIKLHFRFV